MESYEVLALVCQAKGRKAVAAALGITRGTLDKWCRPPAPHGTGARNPLDRLVELAALPGGTALLDRLCREAGGKFVHGEKLRALVCAECAEKIAQLEAIMKSGETQPGGRHCRHRLPDGRCGWRAGRN